MLAYVLTLLLATFAVGYSDVCPDPSSNAISKCTHGYSPGSSCLFTCDEGYFPRNPKLRDIRLFCDGSLQWVPEIRLNCLSKKRIQRLCLGYVKDNEFVKADKEDCPYKLRDLLEAFDEQKREELEPTSNQFGGRRGLILSNWKRICNEMCAIDKKTKKFVKHTCGSQRRPSDVFSCLTCRYVFKCRKHNIIS